MSAIACYRQQSRQRRVCRAYLDTSKMGSMHELMAVLPTVRICPLDEILHSVLSDIRRRNATSPKPQDRR
jgi:hypothetical protein